MITTKVSYAENPVEYHRQYSKAHYRANKEKYFANTQKWRKENPIPFKASRLVECAKRRSKDKRMEFNLTFDWCLPHLLFGICSATGAFFDLTPNSLNAPSIDRKDNSKGYTQDNCWVVTVAFNSFKGESQLTPELIDRFLGRAPSKQAA